MHQPTMHIALESYLTVAPRFYSLHSGLCNEQMKRAVAVIHGLAFKVFLRMASPKESAVSINKPILNALMLCFIVYRRNT